MKNKLLTGLKGSVNEVQIRVIYGDTDAGGMVYNANYLRFFERGRCEYMREFASSYKELEELGYILPVVESYVRYKAPALYEDLLSIKTCLAEVTDLTCRFHCHIHNVDTGQLLVKGFTSHAAINRQGKLLRLPAEYVERLQVHVG